MAEFEQHGSIADALSALRTGEQIWKGVFGTRPSGGKYPAYARGTHGDAAVDFARFAWWCRRWDRGLAPSDDPAAFHPRLFGESGVVDVPSTVDGGLMTLSSLDPTQRFRSLVYYARVLLRSGAWLDEQLDARAKRPRQPARSFERGMLCGGRIDDHQDVARSVQGKSSKAGDILSAPRRNWNRHLSHASAETT